MGLLRRPSTHTYLAAAYPVLALLAANLGQVRLSAGYRPLILSLLGALVLLGSLRLIIKDRYKAGLLATWFLVLFYAYGHAYNALRAVELAGTTLGRHRFLLPIWGLLAGTAAWWLLRRKADMAGWSSALSFVLLLATLFPVIQIAGRQLEAARGRQTASASLFGLEGDQAELGELPDIYYIILDAYARADTLKDTFDYDNSSFLDELRRLGFYVAECSQANYAQTELSLASSLNASYLEDLVDGPLAGTEGRERLWPLIRGSALRSTLESIGYSVVAFETGYYWTELEDADLYLAPKGGLLARMTAFEGTLLRSTAAWALIDALPAMPFPLPRDLDRSADAHRERLLFVFDELAEMPLRPGPKFVFAHIVSPHRPFVFDAQGNPIPDDYQWTKGSIGLERYRDGYLQQITHLNERMLAILERIVTDSDQPPVVLLQGDHGPGEGSSQDRMRILNAILLGDSPQDLLYPQMSPVNSFRIVFHTVFGSPISLLEDRSYFSTYAAPFDYQVIAADCPN